MGRSDRAISVSLQLMIDLFSLRGKQENLNQNSTETVPNTVNGAPG
jgi:hypothetical protein